LVLECVGAVEDASNALTYDLTRLNLLLVTALLLLCTSSIREVDVAFNKNLLWLLLNEPFTCESIIDKGVGLRKSKLFSSLCKDELDDEDKEFANDVARAEGVDFVSLDLLLRFLYK
jgi:hypothetical protein